MIGRLEDDDFVSSRRFLEVENLRCLVMDRYGTIHVGSFLGLLIYPYFLNGGVGIARVAVVWAF